MMTHRAQPARRVLAAMLFLTMLAGCARTYEVNPGAYDMEAIPDFTTDADVSLVNGQPSTEEVVYATDGVQEFKANLNQWTDSAIAIAERELVARGARVTGGADRVLEMAIIGSTTTTGGWGWRTFTSLEVTTGDGYRERYVGEAPSISAFRAADASVMRAVAEMFRDEKIIDYLTR